MNAYPSAPLAATCVIVGDRTPDQSHKKEELIWTRSLRVQSIMMEKLGKQEQEVASHMVQQVSRKR